jgi:hypothetical protein
MSTNAPPPVSGMFRMYFGSSLLVEKKLERRDYKKNNPKS